MPDQSDKNGLRAARTRRRVPSQRRSIDRVETLLDATAQVLNEGGVARLSTNKVARQAGMSIGALYQYFPNKESLLDALVEDRLQRLAVLVRTEMAALATQTFPAAAEEMFRSVIEVLAVEPGLVPVLVSRALGAPEEGAAGRLKREVDRAARSFLEPFEQFIVPNLDTAVLVATNVTGLFMAVLSDPIIGDTQRDEVVAEVVRMLSWWIFRIPPVRAAVT